MKTAQVFLNNQEQQHQATRIVAGPATRRSALQNSLTALCLSAGLLLSTAVAALATPPGKSITSENFNSRKGIPIHRLKASLQDACWTFRQFDINHAGWNPGLEGDGAMVSNAPATEAGSSGIYTPLLQVSSQLDVSFDYTFSENFGNNTQRWIKLCLANPANEIVQVLEQIDFDGVNAQTRKKYHTGFRNIAPGEYRLLLQYGGSGGTTRVAIDELAVSAPLKYPGGCSSVPEASRLKITGTTNRTASGTVLPDYQEGMTAYLIKGSPHGTVSLQADGSFTFTPAKGFKGGSTSFLYKVCESGAGNLCSDNNSVSIYFPDPSRINALSDFKGSYRFNGNVELAWKVQQAANASRFEVERSLDGKNWSTTGSIETNASDDDHYAFIDKVRRMTIQNRDLYYRLKHVDADGNTTLSRMLVVRVFNTKTLTMISVTPNPSRNDIGINIQLQEDAYVTTRVTNNAGAQVMRRSSEIPRGTHHLMLDGSSKLPPGPYMLEVIVNSKERMLVKLIKE